jgi:uncharacterized membrane protein YedE/YeeE
MTNDIWLGLFSGIAFGFVIQRIGATNADKMARAHLMMESDIPKFMLMAVILSAVGLTGLGLTGIGITRVLPLSFGATSLAGCLFGIGWGLCGYCPGTTWAAAGEGRMDAIFALIGGLVGAAVFAHLHDLLIPLLYDSTNLGPLTINSLVGNSYLALLLLVVCLGVMIWIIDHVWGRYSNG